MLKLLANENFDNTIVRGLLRRRPSIDIVRVQDVGLLGEYSPTAGQEANRQWCKISVLTYFILPGLPARMVPVLYLIDRPARIRRRCLLLWLVVPPVTVRSHTPALRDVPRAVCEYLLAGYRLSLH